MPTRPLALGPRRVAIVEAVPSWPEAVRPRHGSGSPRDHSIGGRVVPAKHGHARTRPEPCTSGGPPPIAGVPRRRRRFRGWPPICGAPRSAHPRSRSARSVHARLTLPQSRTSPNHPSGLRPVSRSPRRPGRDRCQRCRHAEAGARPDELGGGLGPMKPRHRRPEGVDVGADDPFMDQSLSGRVDQGEDLRLEQQGRRGPTAASSGLRGRTTR